MSETVLPPELTALVHHIELNKDGWWEKAVQRLCLAVIWLSEKGLTPQGVVDELQNSFSVDIGIAKIQEQTDALRRSGTLLALPNELLVISQESKKKFVEDLHKVEELEAKTKATFVGILKSCCPSLQPDSMWESFNKELLLPSIRMMGARTYELVSGTSPDVEGIPNLFGFLQRYPQDIRQPLRNAILSFMDPRNQDVSSFVLGNLNAYFFLEAGNLKAETLDNLAGVTSQSHVYTLFVDTNFLLSVLELHEAPVNKAASSLLQLITQLATKVKVELYVLPPTVEETRRVLTSTQQSLSGLKLPGSVTDAAMEAGLPGIVQKFLVESAKDGRRLTAETYLEPYIRNLIQILNRRGIKLYNEKIDSYRENSKVLHDVEQQMEYEKVLERHKRKGRAQLEHDVLLWHFIHDKRNALVDSPIEARYWVLTEDSSFTRFDAYKRRSSGEHMPVCLNPNALTQMLRFWVPRTPQFEKAMLNSLDWPFLFHEFDLKSEQTTIRILQTLSQYQDRKDLTKEEIASVLLSEAFRLKVLDTPGELSVESIKTELAKEVPGPEDDLGTEDQEIKVTPREERQPEPASQQLLSDIERSKETLAEVKLQLDEGRLQAATLQSEIQVVKDTLASTNQQLREDRQQQQALSDKIDGIIAELYNRHNEDVNRKRAMDFIVKWCVAPILLIGASGLGSNQLIISSMHVKSAWTVSGICILLLLWVWLADWQGNKNPVVIEWLIFQRFHKARVWFFGILGTIVLGILTNVVTNLIPT